jgi:hypothetical protein
MWIFFCQSCRCLSLAPSQLVTELFGSCFFRFLTRVNIEIQNLNLNSPTIRTNTVLESAAEDLFYNRTTIRTIVVSSPPPGRSCSMVVHGPLKLRTKHGGDNFRSLWRNGFLAKCISRIQWGRKIMHTRKILSQLLSSLKSYSLPKSTTYTEVKSQFLGLQLSRQILSVLILEHNHVRM